MNLIIRILPWLCTLVVLLSSGCTPATQPTNANVLKGDIFWEGDIRLTGEVVIDKDAVLTIAPGTRVLFMPHVSSGAPDRPPKPHELPGSRLLVHGKIFARGTAEQPIVFSFHDPDAPPGSWGGIKVQDAEESYFHNCEFRQAINAIHSCRSWVSVESSSFDDNLVGVLFHNAGVSILRNQFSNNGTAIFYLSGSPVINENRIVGNDNGLVISDASKDYLIENNNFIDNRVYNVGLGERVRRTVDLRNNYWGTTDPEILESKLFDGRSSLWKGEIGYLPIRTEPVATAGVE